MKPTRILENRLTRCLPFVVAAATFGNVMAADIPADEVVKKFGPTIVTIVAKQAEGSELPASAAEPSVKPAASADTKGQWVTSGLIVSSDGLILTECSSFAKRKPDQITVYLEGARQFTATLVGVDARSCLALIKVPVTDAAYAPIKPVQDIAPGERVLALGRTLLGDDARVTVTDGLVSTIFPNQWTLPAIQSSVTLMHGMGGGPLVRQRTGEVIGIITERYISRDQGMQATFATPIGAYLRVADDLRTKGRVERATIGTRLAPLTAETATSLGISGKKGVIVVEVRDKGAAKAAGIETGDIVLEADGQSVTSFDLVGMLGEKRPGEVVRLKLFRRGRTISVDVTTTKAD